MTPSIKFKYKRRGRAPPAGTHPLRRSPRAHKTHSSTTPSPPSTTSFSSSNTENTKTQNTENPLEIFAEMVLSHEDSESQPLSSTPMSVDRSPKENEPSPENMATAEEAAIGERKKERDGTEVEVIDLEQEKARSDPPIKSSPATANLNPPPTTDGKKPEVKPFDLNKPPGDWMKVVGDFDSLFGDKPYYTTFLNGKQINIYKPPHLYVQNPPLAKTTFEKSKFETGSGSRNPIPAVATKAGQHGSTYGSNTHSTSPPIHAEPLRSLPPAPERLFDVLGIPPEFENSSHKPPLDAYQLSLLNTLAKTTPNGPPPFCSLPVSPSPMGGVKRPSGVTINKNPIKKPYNKTSISLVEFEAWQLYQERIKQAAVEVAERRAYKQLWGTILKLQNQNVVNEQKLTEFGLTMIEKDDRIENLEMLLGLAIKSLKMDARELIRYKNLGKKTNEESGMRGHNSAHDVKFGSFTPEEINVLHGKERLLQLNHLLHKVGSGVGCSELAVVRDGCCNRMVVSGGLESLEKEEDERKKERKTENSEVEGEKKGGSREEKKQEGEGSRGSGKEERKKKAVSDDTQAHTEPAMDPTPRE